MSHARRALDHKNTSISHSLAIWSEGEIQLVVGDIENIQFESADLLWNSARKLVSKEFDLLQFLNTGDTGRDRSSELVVGEVNVQSSNVAELRQRTREEILVEVDDVHVSTLEELRGKFSREIVEAEIEKSERSLEDLGREWAVKLIVAHVNFKEVLRLGDV